jgi:hypothetical protein
VICGWWQRWPRANIGIVTGYPGPDVLDVDVRPEGSGYPAYNRLVRAGLTEGALAIVRTPSGGLHAYYRGSTGQNDGKTGKVPRLHLDFKSGGGYVLAPPSRVHGRPYELLERPGGRPGTFDWRAAKALLDPPQERPPREFTGTGSTEHLAAWVAALPHGSHNNGLFWAACRAVERGHDPWPLVDAAVQAGHAEARARRTVASALLIAGGGAR